MHALMITKHCRTDCHNTARNANKSPQEKYCSSHRGKPANNLCFASACKHKSHVEIPNQIKIHENTIKNTEKVCTLEVCSVSERKLKGVCWK